MVGVGREWPRKSPPMVTMLFIYRLQVNIILQFTSMATSKIWAMNGGDKCG